MTSDSRAQRLVDEFEQAASFYGGYSVRHGIAAVLDAAMQHSGPAFEPVACKMVAAAFRAAADQLTPYLVEDVPGAAFCRNKLLAIANELEAQ
jgi:hypothetical protein